MNIDQIVSVVSEGLKKYQDLDSLEFEVRLGIYDEENKRFDSHIGEEHYNTIEKMLKSFSGWVSQKSTTTNDYFSKNLRLSVDQDKKQKCVEKVRLENFTFISENLPLDIRFSISREIPVLVSKFPKSKMKTPQREKERVSREFQDASWDLTKVKSRDENDNIIQVFEFEVEYKGDIKESQNLPNVVFQVLYKALDANYMIDGFLRTKGARLPLEMFSAQMVEK